MIEDLEKELAVERARRAEMNKRFDEQVKEFAEEQKQIHDLKRGSPIQNPDIAPLDIGHWLTDSKDTKLLYLNGSITT